MSITQAAHRPTRTTISPQLHDDEGEGRMLKTERTDLARIRNLSPDDPLRCELEVAVRVDEHGRFATELHRPIHHQHTKIQ